MIQPQRNLVGLAVVIVLAIAALIIFGPGHDHNTGSAPPTLSGLSGAHAQVPSIAALMADPSALKAAAKACVDETGPDVMTLCDHVHSAEAGLLAQKYRQGAAAH